MWIRRETGKGWEGQKLRERQRQRQRQRGVKGEERKPKMDREREKGVKMDWWTGKGNELDWHSKRHSNGRRGRERKQLAVSLPLDIWLIFSGQKGEGGSAKDEAIVIWCPAENLLPMRCSSRVWAFLFLYLAPSLSPSFSTCTLPTFYFEG